MRRVPSIAALTGLAFSVACGVDRAEPVVPAGPAMPAAVTISFAATPVWEASTAAIAAVVLDGRGSAMARAPIAWSSSDTTVALVEGGRLRTRRPGTAVIEARSGDARASVMVEVRPDEVARLDLSVNVDSVIVGRTLALSVVPVGVRGGRLEDRTVAWSTDDSTVATVGADGVVRATSLGATVVRASVHGVADSMVVRVVPASVASIVLTLADTLLDIGERTVVGALALADDGTPLPDRPVTIEVTDSRRAHLEGTVVRAVGSGLAMVRASAGGRIGQQQLRITRPVSERWTADVVFEPGRASDAERAMVRAAVDRWSEVIVAPPSAPLTPTSLPARSCGSAQSEPIVNEVITTLRLYVAFDSLDGRGGAVAAAGPCVVARAPHARPGEPERPVIGVIWVDTMDLRHGNFTTELWHNVLVHEIGHVLGIGTLWHNDVYIADRAGVDPRFVGRNALDAWRALGGAGLGVEVETGGGPGTTGAHWKEGAFRDEVMTGWVGAGTQPLSTITLGALADFGWLVDHGAADPYAIPTPWAASRLGVATSGMRLVERVLQPRFETSGGVTRELPRQ